MSNYYFDMYPDIVSRQGKKCAKCKRSLILCDKLSVINDKMFCGKCGDLESKKASLKREVKSIFDDEKKIALARAKYDRVKKNK